MFQHAGHGDFAAATTSKFKFGEVEMSQAKGGMARKARKV